MRYGTIVEYFPDKHFGFIRPDAGQDVFFHISVVEAVEPPLQVKIGQPVKYEPMPRSEAPPSRDPASNQEGPVDRGRAKQTRAKLVTLIDKLPGGTLADSDANQKSNRHRRARKKKPTWRR